MPFLSISKIFTPMRVEVGIYWNRYYAVDNFGNEFEVSSNLVRARRNSEH